LIPRTLNEPGSVVSEAANGGLVAVTARSDHDGIPTGMNLNRQTEHAGDNQCRAIGNPVSIAERLVAICASETSILLRSEEIEATFRLRISQISKCQPKQIT
jgi:class 3 adenylate cyclase